VNKHIFRGAMLLASACVLSAAVAAQEPPPQQQRQQQRQPARARGGGLDNLSLPSTRARAASASTNTDVWQTFAPEGAGFSVSLPGLPEEATQAARASGQLAPQFRHYRLIAGGSLYDLGRTAQLPEHLFSQPGFLDKFFARTAQYLDAALAQKSRQIKFKLVSEEPISLDGYEGREYEFDAEGHRAVVRLFLIERALFTISVIGPKSELVPENVSRFLNSFAPVE
jgi:hypothetical protein